jgi:DNA-binding XRE family transcriptional regulator
MKENKEVEILKAIEQKYGQDLEDILLNYRNERKYTQLDMVKLIGCSLASYRLWEVGATRPLKFATELEDMLV